MNCQPVILWQNSDLTKNFLPQEVTLNDNIENYSYYEIIYQNLVTTSVTDFLYCKASTGKVPIDSPSFMAYPLNNQSSRPTGIPTGNTIRIKDGRYFDRSTESVIVSNNCCLPYRILGYK